jgi:hypothetical protein
LATGQALGSANNDISATSAFELGRLLGASDGRFLRDLVAWHRATDASAKAAMVGADLAKLVGSVQARNARGAGAFAADPTMPTRAPTTASVKAALGTLLAGIAGKPANLWRVHPAGPRIHAAQTKAKSAGKPGKASQATRKSKPSARKPVRKAKASIAKDARPKRGR